MKCDYCGKETPADQLVVLNGRALHAFECFSAALKQLQFKPSELLIALSPTMSPETAYRLGKSTVATIVRSRSKVKKRGAT